jgi:hypothetical protein
MLLGADTPIKPARIEVVNQTFTVLRQLLLLWNSQSIGTGITIPELLADDLLEPMQTQLVIDHMLAIKVAPYLQKSVGEDVRTEAKALMQQLRHEFSPKPYTVYPSILPVGTGNRSFPIAPTFYPTTEGELDTEQGDPITV